MHKRNIEWPYVGIIHDNGNNAWDASAALTLTVGEPYGFNEELTDLGVTDIPRRGLREYVSGKFYLVGQARDWEVGDGQAYLYPDGTLVLWESMVWNSLWPRSAADGSPHVNVEAIFTGFEALLLCTFPERQIKRLLTPSWEPVFDLPGVWPTFLERLGWTRLNDKAYTKEPLTIDQARQRARLVPALAFPQLVGLVH